MHWKTLDSLNALYKLYSTKVGPNLVHKGLLECAFATVKHNIVLEHRRVHKIRNETVQSIPTRSIAKKTFVKCVVSWLIQHIQKVSNPFYSPPSNSNHHEMFILHTCIVQSFTNVLAQKHASLILPVNYVNQNPVVGFNPSNILDILGSSSPPPWVKIKNI